MCPTPGRAIVIARWHMIPAMAAGRALLSGSWFSSERIVTAARSMELDQLSRSELEKQSQGSRLATGFPHFQFPAPVLKLPIEQDEM